LFQIALLQIALFQMPLRQIFSVKSVIAKTSCGSGGLIGFVILTQLASRHENFLPRHDAHRPFVRRKQESLLRGASLKRPFAKLAGYFPLAVSASSFLLFSWLPLCEILRERFPPCEVYTVCRAPKALKLTLLVEASALLLQDIGAALWLMSMKFFKKIAKSCGEVSTRERMRSAISGQRSAPTLYRNWLG
jgi:hypothetical protein